MINQTILISGLPDSGKTTFIAALWYFIFNGTAKDDYSADSLADTELEYLNTIGGNWAACEKVIRTNRSNLDDVSINLLHNSTGQRWKLDVPDMKGERFNRQFEFRQWDDDFEKILSGAGSLMIFVDPRDHKNKPRLIYKENQVYRFFGDTMPENINPPNDTWTENLAPSQVKLVDFLQTIDYHASGKIKKIAIIVSCWDVLKSEENPELWCKLHVPLLYQYLLANDDLFKSKYFGLSAQGGSYDTKESIEILLRKPPLDRIEVTDGVDSNKNILSPILWLTDDN
jgi:hypothetical protein